MAGAVRSAVFRPDEYGEGAGRDQQGGLPAEPIRSGGVPLWRGLPRSPDDQSGSERGIQVQLRSG